MTPLSIFSFPVELAQDILAFCHPWDVAAFSKTCRAAYSLVYLPTDQYLWRQLYINYFDPLKIFPRNHVASKVNWRGELSDRMKAELDLFRGPITAEETYKALEVLVKMVEESSQAVLLTGSSRNLIWLRNIVRQTHLLSNIYTSPTDVPSERKQTYARLRTYLALTIDPKKDKKTLNLLTGMRDNSRAFVYDLRNYTADTKWGPFLPDGSVNWIHVEHLINVVALNIRELPGSWALTRPPSCIDPPRVSKANKTSLIESPLGRVLPVDWAGVEGTWRRYVCFMDYRDLFAFNFTDLADGPRHPRFFQDPRFREATRLIEVKLHLIPTNRMRFHNSFDLHALESDLYAPLSFTGSSKGVNGNEAEVEGFVRMGHDGVARWQLTSIYDGNPQWSSTGVQIGGVGSAMGVVGTWTTTHHDQDDPAGPFWLWKVEDNSPAHLMEYT